MRILVIGANGAGLSAASKARRLDPEAEILVLERGRDVSYAQCGLPYLLAGLVRDEASLVHFTPSALARERNLDLRTGHLVTSFRLSQRRVEGQRPDASTFAEDYDRLIIATGATPHIPSALATQAHNVFPLHTFDDARRMRHFLAAEKPSRAVIIGASYIGLELAEALRRLHLQVTVLEAASQPLPGTFDAQVAALATEELKRNAVPFLPDAPAGGLEVDAKGLCHAVAGQWGREECDMVLLAVGIRPETTLAEEAGLRLGPTGAIATDRRMATDRPGVFAAGDCAETRHLVTDKPTWVPLGSTANKQGRVAGANAAGGDESFPGVVGTAGLRLFDLELARTGLTLGQARDAGLEAEAVTINAPLKSAYMPDAPEITLSLIVESNTRRILGAQAAGREGVAKRIDLLAVAATLGLTANDICYWDLSYAPPFAPGWDPVLVAANVARRD